jgi:hypothetical protein
MQLVIERERGRVERCEVGGNERLRMTTHDNKSYRLEALISV